MHNKINKKLSIPLWSDFIVDSGKRKDIAELFFQSHYGLILSDIYCIDWWNALATFNPTMVWFYRSIYKNQTF